MENNELPEGWVWTRLGEIGTINPKTTGKNIEDDTEVTFLPMRCVEELTGCFDLSLTKRFSEVKKGYTPFIDDDLIFAKITPCMENGKVALVKGLKNGMGFGSTEFHVIRLSKIIPGKFFFYFLVRQELRKDAKRDMTGSAGQLRVSTSYMQQIIFPLPPLPEQRAIASKIEQLFSDLDNGIENFKKAQAQLKLYRQSVLKAACEAKLVPTEAELARAEGRDYEAADVLLASILKERHSTQEKNSKYGKTKESAVQDINGLSELSEGWIWTRVGEITEKIEKVSPEDEPEAEFIYLDISSIDNKHLKIIEPKKYLGKDAPSRAKQKVKNGDVLFSTVRTYLKNIAQVPSIYNGQIASTGFSILRPSTGVNENFLFYYVQTEKFLNPLTDIQRGTSYPAVRDGDVRVQFFPLPPLTEQRRIVLEVERRLSVSDKMEATITESLLKAESLRQSMLKKAFEGKLLNKKEMEKARNAPDWEPAEKLLERIGQEKARIGEKKRKR